jgi:hypothetical protein
MYNNYELLMGKGFVIADEKTPRPMPEGVKDMSSILGRASSFCKGTILRSLILICISKRFKRALEVKPSAVGCQYKL